MDEAAGHTRRRCERSLRAAAGLVVVVVAMIPVFLLQAYNFHTTFILHKTLNLNALVDLMSIRGVRNIDGSPRSMNQICLLKY